ncbi:YceD family protein [Paracoccus spongiarum]|uniref:DUF177 domain-containing protein n=1 Tax=Paracoccus spongiarum TaxID=3064387 RepID=A0ABT9JAK4_9RHOB|nr:DUF177 domain-containing protein [Paracoccus sp. 2205BS29-5]MDP5306755.1 DUF177 domain-containing protein [Paracoccus sp. 2205BS29-5]
MSTHRVRVAHLNPRQPTPFAVDPDAGARQAIAEELGISGLPKLGFRGEIRAEGGDGWALRGVLTATVVQPCVVTLRPVRTALREEVTRHYSPHLSDPEGDEIEMPDETLEPLGQFIDLGAVAIETLALALPEYPRAEGAALPDAPPDEAPADTRRPFAGLGRMLGRDGEPGTGEG